MTPKELPLAQAAATTATSAVDRCTSTITCDVSTSRVAPRSDTAALSTAPPPAKRVRRDYPWRPEYVRDFGVRPVQCDATTGDVMLVECCFCVSFGREPPPPSAQSSSTTATRMPTQNDGVPAKKTRARTRNIAHWKHPFRTDNMRSHHLQQHAHKWAIYQQLLEQCKQEEIAVKLRQTTTATAVATTTTTTSDADKANSAAQQLTCFFNDEHANELPNRRELSYPAQATATTNGSTTSASVMLLSPIIRTPAIVDVVRTAMIDVPEQHHSCASECGPAPSFFRAIHHTTDATDSSTGPGSAAQYAVMLPPFIDGSHILPLLCAGLSFHQVASVLQPARRLSRGDVAAYSRVVVASSLQRIASLLCAAWTYTIQLHVQEGKSFSSSGSPRVSPMQVSVRVPVGHQSQRIGEFHVVTLALRHSSEDVDHSVALLRTLLSSLDRDWPRKVLDICMDEITPTDGCADALKTQLRLMLVQKPVTHAFDDHDGQPQSLQHAVQQAWSDFLDASDTNRIGGVDGQGPFVATLLELVARLRCDGEWVQRHGHCPIVHPRRAVSVSCALEWLLAHRDVMPTVAVDTASTRWWLVASVVHSVWTSCYDVASATAKQQTPDQWTSAVVLLLQTLQGRCGVSISSSSPKRGSTTEPPLWLVTFNETDRMATLLTETSTIHWSSASMTNAFRSVDNGDEPLGTSTLSAEAEREVSRFVLLTLGHLNRYVVTIQTISPLHTLLFPPTRPLQFVQAEPLQMVDLVETHRRRLDSSGFLPPLFFDIVTRELVDLRTLVASDEQLRHQLQRVAVLSPTPADTWSLLPEFPHLRTLAMGLATAHPPPSCRHDFSRRSAVMVADKRPSLPSRPFSLAENDELPRYVLADLAVEAQAHAQQLERLHDAAKSVTVENSHQSIMLDVAAHMLLLQRQAQIKHERPHDGSFLPLSLTVACLLRQLPAGLAPPTGMLSLHEIDKLPLELLDEKLVRLLGGFGGGDGGSNDHRVLLSLLRSLMLYVKTSRALLAICHEHLSNQRTVSEATQALVGYMVDTLAPEQDRREGGDQQDEDDWEEDDDDDDDKTRGPQSDRQREEEAKEYDQGDLKLLKCKQRTSKDRKHTSTVPRTRRRNQHTQRHRTSDTQQQRNGDTGTSAARHRAAPAMAKAVAVDPSAIMKRALARDVGDGSAIIEIMKKYADDLRIQAHGVRALKSVVRKFPHLLRQKTKPQTRGGGRDGGRSHNDSSGSGEEEDEKEDEEDARHRHQQCDIVQLVLASMRRAPDHVALQRDALFCLLDFASQCDANVAVVTSLGGIVSIMEAMARLPDDEEAQIAALSILGHPVIAEHSVLRVDPQSRRLVLSAMRRFPLSERLQGLSCLALTNLSLRQDESMQEIVTSGGLELVVTAMTRFSDVSLIQAAGSWLLSTVSGASDATLVACLEAGALPVCEKARVRFAQDPRVQQHAVLAIQSLVRDVPPDGTSDEVRQEELSSSAPPSECCVQ